MDKDFALFEFNKSILTKIFLNLSKSEKNLNFLDLQKFCVSSKLIPNYISQNQLKSLISKTSSSAKPSLSFENFENILKLISLQKSSNSSKSEKVKSFFSYLSANLKQNFILSASLVKSINRSNSTYSLKSSQDLNDSNSSLDLSIKEALDTLKSHSRKSSSNFKVNLSPLSLDRDSSNPATPRSRSIRYQSKPKTASSQAIKKFASLKDSKNPGELDEFLETEKMVQSQYSPLKLKESRISRFSQQKPEEKRVDKNKLKIKKCQSFISKKFANSIPPKLVRKLVFQAWKQEFFKSRRRH